MERLLALYDVLVKRIPGQSLIWMHDSITGIAVMNKLIASGYTVKLRHDDMSYEELNKVMN
jgi:hypothetical protein